MVAVARISQLPNAIETCLGRHEPEDVVDGEGDAELTLEGGGLETRPHSKANTRKVYWRVNVEESGRAAKLLQVGFSEGLLEDDVDEVLTHIVVLIVESLFQLNLCARVTVNLDLCLLATELRLKDYRFLELYQRVDRLAAGHIMPQDFLKGSLLGANDLVDEMGLPDLIWLYLERVLPDWNALAED